MYRVTDSPQVIRAPGESRFVYRADGQTAELLYALGGGRIVLVHTGVPEELGGRGIGGLLVTAAMEYAARKELTVVAACPFAKSWLERHPDVAALAPLDPPGPPGSAHP